jgi:hypothetical protein
VEAPTQCQQTRNTVKVDTQMLTPASPKEPPPAWAGLIRHIKVLKLWAGMIRDPLIRETKGKLFNWIHIAPVMGSCGWIEDNGHSGVDCSNNVR